jgi:FixJ family two-component response regulator
MGKMKVAIIDDDDSSCRALSRLVRGVGFDPKSFPSAETFLCDPQRAIFGCLLVDIQLGGMSGLELFRELLERRVRTPVLFITALDDPAARTAAVENGCAGFFRKTDPGTMIIEALNRVALESGA